MTVGKTEFSRKHVRCKTLGSYFKFTAPGTPQQNSVVERKIPTLMGRPRAMMITAGFDIQEKPKFWCEVISAAT